MAVPNTLTNGLLADADEVMENFDFLDDDRFSIAKMSLSSAQSIPNATFTKVTLDTVDFSRHITTSTTNNRITVLKDGLYTVTGYVTHYTNTGGNARGMQFYKNGSLLLSYWAGKDGAGRASFSETNYFEFSTNDYIELYVYQDSGGSNNLDFANLTVNFITN